MQINVPYCFAVVEPGSGSRLNDRPLSVSKKKAQFNNFQQKKTTAGSNKVAFSMTLLQTPGKKKR